jgi:hypothetical protein
LCPTTGFPTVVDVSAVANISAVATIPSVAGKVKSENVPYNVDDKNPIEKV